MKNLKRMGHYLANYKKQFSFMALLMIIIVTMTTLSPYVEGMITSSLLQDVENIKNNVAGAQIQYDVVWEFLSWLLVIYVSGTTARIIMQLMLSTTVQSVIKDLRQDVKEKMMFLPISYYDKQTVGEVMSTISTDVEVVSVALQQAIYQAVYSFLMISLAIVMMLLIDWKLALIGVSIIPLGMIISRIIVKVSQKLFVKQQNSLAKLQSVTQEKLTGFNEIMLYNYQENAKEEFNEANQDLCESGFKAGFISGLMSPSIIFLTYMSIGLTVYFGMISVVEGALLVGALQAMIRYIWQITQPLMSITQLSATIQASFAAMERIFNYLDEPNQTADVDNPTSVIDTFEGNVTFEDVNFGYGDTPILKGVDMDIKPGELVAIVGPTGAGKTTIINLLMRFYDVNSGSIKIDGVDIKDMKRDELRQLFGLVLQDTWLFGGSIRDNIRYGLDKASDEMIEEAAKEANVHHFITTLSEGYDMILNEESSNISNGEKQLLTIARVFLNDPKILILDEATSSIDTRLDKRIQEAMAKLMEGRTSFVIAHRLSTIKNADKILVVKDGNIIEQGNHDSLMSDNGFYADLYNSQFDEVEV